MITRLKKKLKTLGRDEEGAALFEYALVLFTFAGMIIFILVLSWFWWNQYVASIAIHDGVRTAGARYGDLGQGWGVTYDHLHTSLGRLNADQYRDSTFLWSDPTHRSVYGRVEVERFIEVPFLGGGAFQVKVGSFQRRWMFYGGKPKGWE